MRAAVFKGNGVLEVQELPIPKIQNKTQVLLKIKAASICGSDIHGLMVPPAQFLTENIVMGHEFFGEIVSCGEDVKSFEVGDYVTVNPAIPCGECFECTHGHSDICDHNTHYGQTCDGGFAEYAVVESGQLYKLPGTINIDTAAQIEPLACIMGGISKLKPKPEEHVLLYGAGPIGLMYIKVLKALGIEHIAVCAKGKKRIEEAKKFGAEFVIDTEKEEVLSMVLEYWNQPPEVIIDAVGNDTIFQDAVNIISSAGRILLFGFNKRAVSKIPPAMFCVKELQVFGSRAKNFEMALYMINEKGLNLETLVSHRLKLTEIEKGMELMRKKEATRVIIYP